MVEALHEALAHVFMNERVVRDLVCPLGHFGLGGELPVKEQVGNFEIGRLLG